MPRLTVVFNAGASGTATVPGPTRPTRAEPLPQVVTGRLANGDPVTYRVSGVNRSIWTLDLADLSAAERDALQDVFDAIHGPAGTFAYTHTDGVAYSNCRFADPILSWERTNSDLWSASVRIDVPSRVNP